MRTIVLFFAAVIAIAAVSALATRHFVEAQPPTTDAMHRWLHDQLGLTADQEALLERIEERHAAEEKRLRTNLGEANRTLAMVMRENSTYTPAVTSAVENIHLQMGDLQKLSIQHLYDMKSVLTPEQGDKLMALAEAALTEPR